MMRRFVLIIVSLYFGYNVLVDVSKGFLLANEHTQDTENIYMFGIRAVVMMLTIVVIWLADLGFTVDKITGVKIEEKPNLLGRSEEGNPS